MDSDTGRPRWRGEPGRMEVWYATFTAPRTGEGVWLHHEIRADVRGGAEAHGWAAVFPPDAAPVVERFGLEPAEHVPGRGRDRWFDAAGTRVGPDGLRGTTRTMSWDLACRETGRPLYTFPAYAWHRQLLPAAQVVPWPTMTVTGHVDVGDRRIDLDGGRGGLAHIFGDGNAHRWGWLHADLGGGDVLEVVAAQGHHPALRMAPPRVVVRLRVDGQDWPADPLVASVASRARLGLPRWYATVTTATRRLRVGVHVPDRDAVALGYRDPDGTRSTCTNSCRADAEVRLEVRRPTGWQLQRRWSLRATAHAEVGRPDPTDPS